MMVGCLMRMCTMMMVVVMCWVGDKARMGERVGGEANCIEWVRLCVWMLLLVLMLVMMVMVMRMVVVMVRGFRLLVAALRQAGCHATIVDLCLAAILFSWTTGSLPSPSRLRPASAFVELHSTSSGLRPVHVS